MAQRTQQSYKVVLHWRDGKTSEGIGWGTDRVEAATDVMNSMGYGRAGLAALDYWSATEEQTEGQDES